MKKIPSVSKLAHRALINIKTGFYNRLLKYYVMKYGIPQS
jgi:hypothetical protein